MSKQLCIWQLGRGSDKLFLPYHRVLKMNGVDLLEYHCVYETEYHDEPLERIFKIYNIEIPEGYKGHSLSVSDILEIRNGLERTLLYVDSFGFVELSEKSLNKERK